MPGPADRGCRARGLTLSLHKAARKNPVGTLVIGGAAGEGGGDDGAEELLHAVLQLYSAET
jgi:hypothetical protein